MAVSLIALSQPKLEQWWKAYKEEQASWGGILLQPYPELLTTWYAERLIDGSIPASKENILAAKRHMFDLSRQGTEDFPWIFDEQKGHRPVRFIEENCKPTEGDFDQFVLQPWQHFVIGSLYGWINKNTGERRFREGLVFVSRKNGKTSLIGGLSAYMLGYDDEKGSNVYVLANAKDQASLLFDKTKEMVKNSPRLDSKYKNLRSTIKDVPTFSKMEPRASDSKKLDGLNTHFGIFDEIHEFTNYKLINVIKKSRGTRKKPLIVYITTAGYVLDGPLMEFYDNALDCLDHIKDGLDERVFYYIAKLDDAQEADDPTKWIKANPNIGLMNFVSLVTDWKTERNSAEQKADWITKQFNLFSDIDELSYLDMETINKNNKVVDWKDFYKKECVGGYDLSETQDYTSADVEFPIYETGEVAIKSHSWISQKRYNEDNNKQRLDAWIKEGGLTITPGEWFVEQSKMHKIIKIRYDRKNSLVLNQQLIDYGFEMEEARQGFMTLGGPMKDLKERFLDGKVIFNNLKIYRWFLSNVKLVQDRNNNWMPTKQSKNRKIDGFAASLNSHATVVELLATGKQTGSAKYYSIDDLRNM